MTYKECKFRVSVSTDVDLSDSWKGSIRSQEAYGIALSMQKEETDILNIGNCEFKWVHGKE